MTLILILDLLAVAWLCSTATRKGLENALPLTAFLLLLFPNESQLELPGLFGLTTQRLIVITLVALYFTLGRSDAARTPNDPLPLKYLVILVMVWMLISSATSVVPDVSFKATLSQLLDYFVPYYIFARVVSKTETVHRILFAFVAAMFVCSIFGAFEAYADWSVLSLFPSLPSRFSDLGGGADRGIRVQSTFGHAILFGAALAMAIPMALYLLTVVKDNSRKIFLWSATMLMVLCIYKTDSRGPWMALAMSLVILLVFGRGRMRKYLTVIALLAVTVLVARPGVRDTILNLYGATLDPDSPQGQSYQWRYELYNVAKRELSKNTERSLLGYGPESFFYLGLTTEFSVDGEMHNVKVDSCDSAIVELMMDTGYVGLLLIATLLLKAAFSTLWQNFKMPGNDGALCLLFFVNIVAFCFMMASVELFGWGQQTYMLWIVLALSMIYPSLARASSCEDEGLKPSRAEAEFELAEASL